ncbi:MAG: hypothetical protein DA405_06415 [Bacteroidetes bacterium]|nr:MAG: hypothetical protein DA405_06415 [Bacteroidota bacterium]
MKAVDPVEFINHIRELLELEDSVEINLDSKHSDIEEWDSLVVLSFMAMVKEEYGVEIGGEDVRKATTLRHFYELISHKPLVNIEKK